MTATPRWVVVCVDDDPSVLSALARSLRRDDLEIRTTESPTDVLIWIANDDVAVLISDYEMPEMTGAQLAGQAKRLRPETVRILLTGQRTLETAIDGINQGEIFRFVAKPFERDELRAIVDAAVERHRELAEVSGERQRRERRRALRDALDKEYPGITEIARDAEGRYRVPDPRPLARQVGWITLARALGDPGPE
jgi:DNA-binding NtrC family response regulator